MKFWRKLFLFSFVFFFITFNVTNIYVIEKKYNSFVKHEIQSALAEQASFYTGLQLSVPFVEKLRDYAKLSPSKAELVNRFVQSVYQINNKQALFIEMLDDQGDILYSNVPFQIPKNRPELNDLKPHFRQYVVRQIDQKRYIFISTLFELDKDSFPLTYIRDLSNLNAERKREYLWFIRVDIIVSIVFIILFYFVSSYITRPIHLLIDATKRISKGHFTEKVNIDSKDEFALLASHFNKMSDVIEEQMNMLKQNNDEKQRFINNLTHELNTPLTSIIGYADLLRKMKYDEQLFNEGLTYIYSEGKRLEELAFHLMALLEKRESVSFKNASILAIIMEVKGSLKPILTNKQMTINVSGETFTASVEIALIKTLFINIIMNSIKASEPNSSIDIICDSTHKCVEIRDYGIGISKEHMKHLFEPFYMVNDARTRLHNGAGLGLSICKKIIELHQGSISLESEINKGTTVKIHFY